MPLPVVPSIDWNDQAISELPEQHRTPQFLAWMQGFAEGSNGWINENFELYCYGGVGTGLYNSSTTYALNDIVVGSINAVSYSPFHIFDPTGVYISLQDGNTGNSPSASSTFWYKISPSYIGAQERVQYNAQKLLFEYALNRWFITTFRNPTAFQDGSASGQWYTPISDIWIQTKTPAYLSFQFKTIGEINNCNLYTTNNGIYGLFTYFVSGINTSYKFVVWIPTSLSISLGLNYVSIVTEVVNKFRLVGTQFSISVY